MKFNCILLLNKNFFRIWLFILHSLFILKKGTNTLALIKLRVRCIYLKINNKRYESGTTILQQELLQNTFALAPVPHYFKRLVQTASVLFSVRTHDFRKFFANKNFGCPYLTAVF